LQLGMLHGKMQAEKKQQVMMAFRDGRIDVLVATTVVEVGIDVPNASVMLVENVTQFGLSQLHQLRGRVGRGKHPSFCLLVGDAANESSGERINAMVTCSSGFDLAELDLKLRGPGEFFGTRQHGLPQFRLADITGELEMLQATRTDALELLRDDPQLRKLVHQELRQELINQFGDRLELAQIG